MGTPKPGRPNVNSASPGASSPPAIVQRRSAAGAVPAVPAPCGGNVGRAPTVQRKSAAGGAPAPCGGNVGRAPTVQRKSAASGGPSVPPPCGGNVAPRALVQRKASAAPPQRAVAGVVVQQKTLTDAEVDAVRDLLHNPPGSSTLNINDVIAGRDATIANHLHINNVYGPVSITAGSLKIDNVHLTNGEDAKPTARGGRGPSGAAGAAAGAPAAAAAAAAPSPR